MRRVLNRLLLVLMIILLGIFIVRSGIVEDVFLPRLEEYLGLDEIKDNPTSETENSSSPPEEGIETFIVENPQAPPETVDASSIRDTIFQLTNSLREEQGSGPLVQNDVLEQAANIRAEESAQSFSHTRPNGTEFHTVLNENGLNYLYFLAGENLAMATHHLSDTEMASFLFDGWVNSPGHYKNMIEPDYQEMGVGVYYDGEILYLVQIFGSAY